MAALFLCPFYRLISLRFSANFPLTFYLQKRAEGKPYMVYMTAGANKFLRIYYGRVKEYLATLEGNPAPNPVEHT